MKKLMTPFLTTLAITGLLVLLLTVSTGSPWADWTPATCLESSSGCFCEADQSEIVRQPVNAISSLAFVFVGLLILSSRAKSWMALLGWSSLIVGLGSAFYHMSLSFAGQFADVLGMHMIGALLIVLAIREMPSWSKRAAWLYVGMVTSTAVILFFLPDTRRYLFAIFLLAGIVCEYALNWRTPGRDFRLLNLGIGAMAAGFGIWILDQTGMACVPTSLFQGHAFWHILGACAVWLLYRYYFVNVFHRQS